MAKLLAAPEIVANPDYQRVADLLDVLGRIRLRLAELENRINTEQIDLIDRYREEVVTLQAEEETAVAELEQLATKNPQWFETRQSVKTLTGVIKYKHSDELVADDEESR